MPPDRPEAASPRGAAELLIRGGLLVDGSGAPPRSGDVRVLGDRIVEVGPGLARASARIVEADGCVVAPGFIDMHTHSDLSVVACPGLDCALRQGVTTLVVGNCGLTAFPLEEGHRTELQSYLAPLVASSGHRLGWGWHDLAGFYAEALGAGAGANLVPLVGHGSIRLAVRGFAPGAASASERASMERLLGEAFRQGARGLSLGLLYPPGCFADPEELLALVGRTAGEGRLLAVHIRNEGDAVEAAVGEAIALCAPSGPRLQLSHQKAVGRANWGKARRTLLALDAAAARGLDVALDVWPYTSGSTTITALLPAWVFEGGAGPALQRLGDPGTRRELRRQIEEGALEGEDLLGAVGFEGIVIAECPRRPELCGSSLREVFAARGRGAEPWEAFFDLLWEIELGATMIIRDELNEEDLRTLLRDPRCCLGSDSWATAPELGGKPHPRTYGAMARFLRRYVLDEGLLSLEEGIRRLTSLPADRLGLLDRGRLAPGFAADVVVLDPTALREAATFADPHRYAEGVRHLVVNGELVLHEGERSPGRAGRLLLA